MTDKIKKVENNTLDMAESAEALKERTDQLAAKQDEILRHIKNLSIKSPLVQEGVRDTP